MMIRFVFALLLCIQASTGFAQQKRTLLPGYPSKPIRVLVTVAPGGGLDIITRAVANKLGERLAFPLVVDNVSGANGVIAVNMAMSALPDGYTLLSTGGSLPINTVFRKFEQDVRQGLAPVAQMCSQPYLIFVPVASSLNSVKDMIAYAKSNPGKLNYGSSGVGSVIHMGMEVIEANAGIDMVHVAYKGNGPANLDLAAGRLDILMGSISGIQLVRTGKARLIGVATPQRLSDYPDVPTVSESGLLNYELSNTYSLYAPIRTATSIIAGLNREVIDLLSAPELKAKFAADFATAAPPRSPEELRKILLSDIERWDGVVKKAGIKLEE